ncbi:MAG TPA: hypothetical protein PLD59_03120 [Tepidisphaeraceae bacterium]|jgi:hypothetical protein|nr:hypothetical protein [Tepidisphaeraceae bacterium]
MKRFAKAAITLTTVAIIMASARLNSRWTYPVDEYDACLALLATGQEADAKEAKQRLEELRPTIAYLASLDPRE